MDLGNTKIFNSVQNVYCRIYLKQLHELCTKVFLTATAHTKAYDGRVKIGVLSSEITMPW